MPISQARMTEWSCGGCGKATSRLTWLAVDAVERPDLVAQVSDLLKCECPCGHRALRRTEPLLVLRLAKAAPVIAARSSDDELDPLESLGEVVATVQRELGDALRDVPGPAIVVTFDEIEAGAHADIDTDVEKAPAGAGGAAGRESAYGKLLRKIVAIQNQQRIDVGLDELARVWSEAQLREVVERFPEIMTDEAEALVAAGLDRASTEVEQRFVKSMLRALQLSRRGDIGAAWSAREAYLASYWEETVAARFREFEDASRGASRQLLAQAGGDLLAVWPLGVHQELQVEVAATTLGALLDAEGADNPQNVEDAVALGQRAISILEARPDLDHPERRLPIAINLSGALGMRSRGDPAWNLSQAIVLLKEALDRFPRSVDPDSWAMAQTNFALLLIDRGEAGDHDQAREHLKLALTHRSFRRNPRDWAYTQLNLASTYSRAESGSSWANVQRAIRHSAKARVGARLTNDKRLLAQAEHNLAAEQYRLSQMAGLKRRKQTRLLHRAEASATEAARLSPVTESPHRFSRAWLTIGRIRSARGDEEEAIEAAKTAMAAMSLDTAPTETRETSRLLMELAEEQGDVELAADAAEHLVRAVVATASSRSRAQHRFSVQRAKKSTDIRFAAHALARAGRLTEALVAIESGRARELGLLLLAERLDLDTLSHLDPRLSDQVEAIGTAFRVDILGLEGHSMPDLADRFATVRTAIRQTPTFEKALDPPSIEEAGDVAQPQRPLVYLGSAPRGSFAIVVDRDRDGNVELDAIHAPDCKSSAIAQLAIVGISPRTHEIEGITSAYLLAQMHAPENLDGSLAALSPPNR